MRDEVREIFEWLMARIETATSTGENLPAWLEGAAIALQAEAATPTISINCSDGSSFAILVLQHKWSAAKREEAERERERRLASPEYKAELETVQEDVVKQAAKFHQEHDGPFSTCNDTACRMWREWMVQFGVDPYITEVDDDIVS